MQQIGRYILDESNVIALETLVVITARCGVQPSAIVRFANAFGFDGPSQMQKPFHDGLLGDHAVLGSSERVRQLDETANAQDAEPRALPAELVDGIAHAAETVGIVEAVETRWPRRTRSIRPDSGLK